MLALHLPPLRQVQRKQCQVKSCSNCSIPTLSDFFEGICLLLALYGEKLSTPFLMTPQEIEVVFQISPTSVIRLRTTRALLYRIAYRPDSTRNRRPAARMRPFLTFLNDRVPFASGRNYRIQNGTGPLSTSSPILLTSTVAPTSSATTFFWRTTVTVFVMLPLATQKRN